MARVDGHIHIERGDYSLEWIQQFVDKAVETQMDKSACSNTATYLKNLDQCIILYVHTVSLWMSGFKEKPVSISCQSI